MSKESRLIKTTGIIAFGNICTKFVSFFMLPLYTAILSTEEYGTVDLIGTYVALIAVVLTLQFEQGIFRFLIDVRNDEAAQKKYISTSIYAITGMCVAFAVISIPVLSLIKYQYTFQLVVYVIAVSVNAIVLQIPRGLGKNVLYAIGSTISGTMNIVLNVLFIAVLKYGINGMLIASILSISLSTFFIFRCLGLQKYISRRYIDRSAFNELQTYSFPLIPNTLCWWVVSVSDRIIINFFIDINANGIYSVACKFPSIFSMLANMFQMAWTESAAVNVDDGSDGYFQKIINQAIKFYSSCNLGIIAVMPFLFTFLVNKNFESAYLYIPLLMTGAFFHSVADLYGSIYTAFKMTKKIALTTLYAAILNIVINVAFINSIGIYAAAISTLMAYFIIAIYRHIDVQKNVKIRIPVNYIFMESIAYLVVFFAYYFKNVRIQILVFILLLPYCVWQNREVLFGMLEIAQKKFGKGGNK